MRCANLIGFQSGTERSARDQFSANHSSDRFNVTASQEVTSVTCDCACHGSRDVIEALMSELRAAKQELMRSREQLAVLRQTEAKLRQRYQIKSNLLNKRTMRPLTLQVRSNS